MRVLVRSHNRASEPHTRTRLVLAPTGIRPAQTGGYLPW